jgi:hypothetical protein
MGTRFFTVRLVTRRFVSSSRPGVLGLPETRQAPRARRARSSCPSRGARPLVPDHNDSDRSLPREGRSKSARSRSPRACPSLSRGPRSRRRHRRGVEKPWCLDKLGMTGLGTGGHFVRRRRSRHARRRSVARTPSGPACAGPPFGRVAAGRRNACAGRSPPNGVHAEGESAREFT